MWKFPEAALHRRQSGLLELPKAIDAGTFTKTVNHEQFKTTPRASTFDEMLTFLIGWDPTTVWDLLVSARRTEKAVSSTALSGVNMFRT